MLKRRVHFFCLLAVFAYLANGAQAHLRITDGETISVPVCGNGLGRSIEIQLGGEYEDTSDHTCCGHCLLPILPAPAMPALPVRLSIPISRQSVPAAPLVYSGSPFWPGAPPQGPPTSRMI